MVRRFVPLVVAVLLGCTPFLAPASAQDHPVGRADALEEACKAKTAGDDCEAETADGKKIEGTCFSGAPPGETNGPPLHCKLSHPGELACKLLTEAAECSFNRPGDSLTTTGKCFKTPHGSLMCRMGDPGQDAAPIREDGILPPHLACKNLTVGDECKTHGPGNVGLCTKIPGGRDEVHCRNVMPGELACSNKKEKDDCEFKRPGPDNGEDQPTMKGQCNGVGPGDLNILVCRPDGRGPGRLSAGKLRGGASKRKQDSSA